MSNFINGEKNIAAIHQGYGKDVSAIYKGSEMIWPDDECLTFSLANGGSYTINWVKQGSAPSVTFYYRYPGYSWNTWTSSVGGLSLKSSSPIVQVKATATRLGSNSSGYHYFTITQNSAGDGIYCTGNIMSLISGATTITQTYCFHKLFQNCNYLLSSPQLPATTLANFCYSNMFNNCKNLIIPPALPSTTLAQYCYQAMFYSCTALPCSPVMPYVSSVPNYAYNQMFQYCSSLKYVKALFDYRTNITTNWLTGVSSSGTFVKNPDTTWTTGNNGIPSGWTVETASS